MTKHNIGYKVFLEGRNASSNMIYVFIDPRINSQAGRQLLVDGLYNAMLFAICVGHEQTLDFIFKEIKNTTLMNLKTQKIVLYGKENY